MCFFYLTFYIKNAIIISIFPHFWIKEEFMRFDSVKALLAKREYTKGPLTLIVGGAMFKVNDLVESNAGDEYGFEFTTEGSDWGYVAAEAISGIIFPPSPKVSHYGKF